MFGLLFRFLSLLASTALPIYGSYRALEQNDLTLLRSWLMYWVVISLQFSFEAYLGFLVMYLPFFQLFRFFFILWLMLPQTQGASQIYLNHISPFLELHEGQIDTYIYTAHEKVKVLGADYLARLFHYAKEYISHYMMNTEIHSYVPPAQATPAPASFAGPEAAGSSYIDTFFSKFKHPPTLASLDEASLSGRPSDAPYLSDPSASGTGSTMWNSIFKAGAAAIQSTLQLPKVPPANQSSDSNKSNLSNLSNLANLSSLSNISNTAVSFGALIDKLDHQLITNNAGVSSAASDTALTTGSDAASTLTLPKSRAVSDLPKTPSTSSLNDFDIIKYDESIAPTSADTAEDESAYLLGSHQAQAPQARRSTSWFKWGSQADSEDVMPANPVKLT